MYAIFKALGKQFRAVKGGTLRLPYQEKAVAGDKLTFGDVLLTLIPLLNATRPQPLVTRTQ